MTEPSSCDSLTIVKNHTIYQNSWELLCYILWLNCKVDQRRNITFKERKYQREFTNLKTNHNASSFEKFPLLKTITAWIPDFKK